MHATPWYPPATRPLARAPLAALSLVLAALVGCSSSPRSGDPQQPPRAATGTPAVSPEDMATAEAFHQLGFRLSWKGYAIVSPGTPLQSLDIFDDTIIAHDEANVVTALETTSARVRWHDQIANDLEKYLGNFRMGDNLLAISQTEVTMLDIRTGNLVGRQRLPELASTAPVINSGVVVYGSARGNAIGHSLETGFKAWWIPMNTALIAPPINVGTDVCLSGNNGFTLIAEAETGRTLMRQIQLWDGLDNSPVASEDSVFFAARDQSVWAFDRYDASMRWRIRTDRRLSGQPVLHENALYVPIPGRGLVSFAASQGSVVWEAPDVTGEVVAVQNGRLLTRDGRTMQVVDPASGDVIETVTIPAADLIVFSTFVDGDLYLAFNDGEIHRYTRRF